MAIDHREQGKVQPGGLDVFHKEKTGLIKFRDEDTGSLIFAKMSGVETWEIGANGVRLIMASGHTNRIKSRLCEFDAPWSELEDAINKKVGKT